MIDLSEQAIAKQFAAKGWEMRQSQIRLLDSIREAFKEKRSHYVVENPQAMSGQSTLFGMVALANPQDVVLVTVGARRERAFKHIGVPAYNPNTVAYSKELYEYYSLALVDLGGTSQSERLRMRSRLVKPNATVFIS